MSIASIERYPLSRLPETPEFRAAFSIGSRIVTKSTIVIWSRFTLRNVIRYPANLNLNRNTPCAQARRDQQPEMSWFIPVYLLKIVDLCGIRRVTKARMTRDDTLTKNLIR